MKVRQRIGQDSRATTLSGCCLFLAMALIGVPSQAQALPDAPSALLAATLQASSPQANQLPPDIAAPGTQPPDSTLPCEKVQQSQMRAIPWLLRSPTAAVPCRGENPLQQIISSKNSPQLTPELKGFLAIRNVADPFNLLTIAGYSGIVIAANAHSDYGPGFGGWGRLSGYSLLEDMQTEFFGTFAVPSLVREDPRYHRLPGRPFRQRLFHALVHTVVSQHDDGRPMPNYATLLTYPISDELSNLYVPGLSTTASSTAKRIVAGYGTDPVGPLIAEFLPDVAKHIHIRVVFVQQILQKIAAGQPNTAPQLF